MAEGNESWKSLVHAYIDACYREQMQTLTEKLNGPKSQFLAQHGSQQLGQRLNASLKRQINYLLPQEGEETWEVVVDSEREIVVDVLPSQAPFLFRHAPFEKKKIELKFDGQRWKMEAIYQACLDCNSFTMREVGRCSYCRKIDYQTIFGTVCKHCNGTGQCSKCAESDFPGWVAST